jgi:hypothetical protein
VRRTKLVRLGNLAGVKLEVSECQTHDSSPGRLLQNLFYTPHWKDGWELARWTGLARGWEHSWERRSRNSSDDRSRGQLRT